MFENASRIENIRVFDNLAFNGEEMATGKWLVLMFKSYSGAKKTL